MSDGTVSQDDPAGSEQPDGGSRRVWTIAVAVLLAVGVIVAIVVVTTSGDDSDDESPVASGVDSTRAPDTAAPAATEAPDISGAPETTVGPSTELTFTISDIEDGGAIPIEYTCDGADDIPVITVSDVPAGTQQMALIMDDPDAPFDDPFVHWVIYEIPADATEITDGVADFTYGLNGLGETGWFGPCPPEGDGPHGYVFSLFALDTTLDLDADLDAIALAEAIAPAVITEAEIIASYERA